jgi:hypothetical protein
MDLLWLWKQLSDLTLDDTLGFVAFLVITIMISFLCFAIS